MECQITRAACCVCSKRVSWITFHKGFRTLCASNNEKGDDNSGHRKSNPAVNLSYFTFRPQDIYHPTERTPTNSINDKINGVAKIEMLWLTCRRHPPSVYLSVSRPQATSTWNSHNIQQTITNRQFTTEEGSVIVSWTAVKGLWSIDLLTSDQVSLWRSFCDRLSPFYDCWSSEARTWQVSCSSSDPPTPSTNGFFYLAYGLIRSSLTSSPDKCTFLQ